MDIRSFLARVLPEAGVKFIAFPQPRSSGEGVYWKHIPVETFEQAERYITALDKDGYQVYYACASYAQKFIEADGRRKYRVRENVQSAKSFWVDIDCGEGKDYATQADGLSALEGFLADTRLPRPLIVNSGNGIHAYWSVEIPISPDLWQPVATYLREVCLAYDLRIDAKCTTDICRVLRPIGTHNRKGLDAKAVHCIADSTGISLLSFARQLKELAAARSVTIPERHAVVSRADVNEFAIPITYAPVSAIAISRKCGQVRAFAEAKGNVSEPLWFNMLGLLKHTEEGEGICQEWSSGHPSYDARQTSSKIIQWQRGPATCESIRAANPSGCDGCEFRGKIKSPISLGAVLPNPAPIETKTGVREGVEPTVESASGVEEETASETAGTRPPDAVFRFDPENPEFPAELRDEFSWNGQHLLVRIESASGVASIVPMCDTILWPLSYHRAANGVYHMVWRAVHHKKQYDFELSAAAIAIGGRELWSELGSRGVVARSGKKKYMEAYITNWFNALKRRAEETNVFTQFGWQKDWSFVVGNKQYKANGDVIDIRLAGDAAQPGYAEAFVSRGSAEAWSELVDKAYNYEGQEQYQFMLSIGFGAPLLRLFENYGGLTINTFSPQKGLGKSTAGKLAVGIWGDPKQLIRTKQQTTYKAYIAHCGVMNSLPVMMDEATNIESRELSDILYTFSQGTPRVILDRSGKMNMHQQSWSTIQLATANRSMVSLVGAMKANADAEMGRIFEYQFSKVSKLEKESADEILGHAETLYGTAGAAYASYLVQHRKEVEFALHEARRRLDRRIDLSVQDRFVSAGLACVVVGATVAKNLGLVRFDIERLVDWIVLTARGFKEAVTSSTPPVIDVFGKMLTELTKGFIVTTNEGDTATAGKAATVVSHPSASYITGRLIEDQAVLFIQQSSIRQWCAKNQSDYGDMFRTVIERGWASPDLVNANLGKGTREYGLAPTRCWRLDVKRMNGEKAVEKILRPLEAVK